MKRFMISACVMLVCIGSQTMADADKNVQKGRFYGSVGAAFYEGPDATNIGYDGMDGGPGLILGYGLSEHWGFEILGAQMEADFDQPAGSGEDDVTLKWASFMYRFDDNNGWQPFLLFGAGRSEYDFENVRDTAKDNQFHVGAGIFRHLTDNLSLRADVRALETSKSGGYHPFAYVGLTAFVGGEATAYAAGDADGDGVRNEIDKCPTTPAGRVVDADGCELDSDGDGVVDGDDQCPGTPAGVAVDSKGCPLDSDGDGVPDYLDECPDSERGAKVDEKGCYILLEEEVTIDMNIEFDTDRADIRPDHVAEINRAVKFLREYPETKAVIEGHTDSDGAASYNQGLSERRAEAVYDYLISSAGIDAERLTWAGFGETRPIADNGTAQGKQNNRRVTAVVEGTHTVRQ